MEEEEEVRNALRMNVEELSSLFYKLLTTNILYLVHTCYEICVVDCCL